MQVYLYDYHLTCTSRASCCSARLSWAQDKRGTEEGENRGLATMFAVKESYTPVQ